MKLRSEKKCVYVARKHVIKYATIKIFEDEEVEEKLE
jgi:hypothetical protein